MNFYTALQTEILENLLNVYHPQANAIGFKQSSINSFKKLLRGVGLFRVDFSVNDMKKPMEEMEPHMAGLNEVYLNLKNEADRKLLVQLMASRIIKGKILLPLNNTAHFENMNKFAALFDANDTLVSKGGMKLNKTNLAPAGFPLTLYQNVEGVYTIYNLQQYLYKNNDFYVRAEEGDYVIDGGGCFGDTALYFASQAKKAGKVFSFEFIPSNLEVFNKNLSLNPDLAGVVEIVKNPLWEFSGKKLFYKDWGPGSILSEKDDFNADGFTETISIDDFVERNSVPRINFIKMDIEGAEFPALNGALKTIRKHKPKLAIALYHSIEDFARIPKLINDLNLGYRFYLGHYTPYGHETIMFASCS
ncbi:MAG: putative SAM-dependent methyltransferase [Bacteroidota bacterium]|nr:putative SAM-dependent methyltransferase [Bacteroidota bacterium]